MSLVTNVLIISLEMPPIANINRWLLKHDKGYLVRVNDYAGGDKHPEVKFNLGAFNYLDIESFKEAILNAGWKYPEQPRIIIQSEDHTSPVIFCIAEGKLIPLVEPENLDSHFRSGYWESLST